MAESILKDKTILVVDDEPDVLTVLEEEIKEAYPDAIVHNATTYKEASARLASWTYDLVVLDIMGVRGFDLLRNAVLRQFPVVMLTAHALSPEALRQSIELGARAYLPKEKIGEIVPFLEDVLRYENLPGWARLLQNLAGFFNSRWGENWKRIDEKFWKDFDEKIAFIRR